MYPLPGSTRDARKRQAYNLLARGFTIARIAKTLKIGESTVQQYIAERRQELAGTLDVINREDYTSLVFTRFEQLRQEAWSTLEGAKNNTERLKTLKLILDVETREVDVLQQLGVLDVVPKKEEHTINATVQIEQVNRVHLDALAAQILSAKMGISPQEALALCGTHHKGLPEANTIDMPMEVKHSMLTEEEQDQIPIQPLKIPLDLD